MAIPSDSASMMPAPMPPPVAVPSGGRLVEYEAYIESQLRKTRSHVWSVELAGALMLLAAGTLGYFFVAGLVDHWVVPGGLGFWGRLTALFVFLALVAVFLARQVLPLLLLRINPLYAAYTIERSRPALKNGLLNFLFFRANPGGMSEAVYQAIEEQAATNLAKVNVEAAVDRSKLIQIGYVLVGIILACAAYTLFSPKDLFKSASRVVMPWADLQAPTRTLIAELEPGDSQAFRGQQVTVKARIEGLPSDGKVTLLYTTADGQTVDRAIELTLPVDGYKYAAVLPAGDATLQQPLSYRIEAGDAVTRQYALDVVAAPTIAVNSVEYKYPAYTGLLAQRVEQQGDVKAIEGTQVTIHALANEPIESAYIDFDGDATLDQRMQVDGVNAQATFTAALQPDRTQAAHHSYQLVFKNEAGQQNLQPVRHQIEVTRDLAPEIQFVLPKKDEIDLPLNGAVDLEVVANDPDFALRRIKLSTASGKGPLKDVTLLDEVRRGQFVRKIRFTPGKLGLKAGDVVVYSAVAEDNKDPLPNRTETPQRRIRLISPSGSQAPRDQVAKDDAADGQKGQPQDKGQGGGDDEHPRAGEGEPEKGPGKRDPVAANKPDAEPGDPADEQQPGDDTAKDDAAGEKGGKQDAAQQGDKQGDTGQEGAAEGSDKQSAGAGEKNGGEKGAGEKGADEGAEPSAANDGSNDSDAIERILKHREEQNKGAGGSSDADKEPSQQQPDSGKQKQSKPGQDAGKKSARQDPANKTPPQPSGDREQSAGQQDESDQPDQQGKKGQQKPGQQKQQGPQGAGESGEGESGDDGAEAQKQQGDKSGKSSGKGNRPSADPQDSGEQSADPSATEAGKQGRPSDAKSDKDDASDAQPGDDAAQGKSRGDTKTGPKPPGAKPAAGEPQDTQGEQGQPADTSDQKGAGKKSSGDPKNSNSKSGAAKDQQDQPTSGKDADPGKSGQGDKSRGEPGAKPDQQAPGDEKSSDANGGDGEKDKGNSGAGQRNEGDKGSPSPQGANQPRDKAPRQSSEDQKGQPKDSPQSPSQSHRESDSEGQDDGDRSGGGKKGGGQKANKSGTGGAGQNTPSDEGAGRSEDPGQGETSDQAPGKEPSADKTGQSGSKPGAGTTKAPSGGNEPQAAADKPPGGGGEAGQSPAQNPQGPSESGASNQPGGGKPGANQSPDRPWTPTTDAAEKANLDYARKATDLALSHLKDELAKDRPDPELLNRLGWTRGDLEKFVKRWEQLRGPARTNGESGAPAQHELDEALRSLGLRPRATSMQGNAGRDDKSQGYKESRRTSPPPEYAEQYKAYTQGTAKGGK